MVALPPHVAINQVTCVTLAGCLVRKTELSFRITATKVKTPRRAAQSAIASNGSGLIGTKMLGKTNDEKAHPPSTRNPCVRLTMHGFLDKATLDRKSVV